MRFKDINLDKIIHPEDDNYKFNLPKFFTSWIAIAVIFGIIILGTSFYTIKQDEAGVVLRFGKFVRITDPGLHFKLPFRIEVVFPVKVERNYQEEFGFRTKKAGVRTVYSQKSYDDESLILTGDLNVLDVEWIVQYKMEDPYAVLFRIRDIRKAIRDISESIVRKIIGDYTFDEVLPNRTEINNLVKQELQKVLDSYGAGIKIETVKLQDVTPPDPVKPAFNEVNEAKQEKEKLINQAWEIYNQKIPQAKGEALKMVKEAEGYALEKINTAEGDAKRFRLLLEAYNQAKEITLKRLYLENMNEILKKAGKKYIIDPQQQSILPLLKLKDE